MSQMKQFFSFEMLRIDRSQGRRTRNDELNIRNSLKLRDEQSEARRIMLQHLVQTPVIESDEFDTTQDVTYRLIHESDNVHDLIPQLPAEHVRAQKELKPPLSGVKVIYTQPTAHEQTAS